MSHYPSDLCVQIVYDAYGELASRIFQGLVRNGRTTIPALQRITHLSLRHLRHGLSVLIQQHLAFWCLDWVEEQAIFEPNFSAAYNLIRTGKYVKTAESKAGEYAGTIISHLLLLGHAKVGDLTEMMGPSGQNENGTGQILANQVLTGETLRKEAYLNGKTNGDSSMTKEKLHSTLCELLKSGLIFPFHESALRSDTENSVKANRIFVKLRDKALKSDKARDEKQEEQVRRKLHQWNFGTRKERREIKALDTTQKRPLEDSEEVPAGKRRRTGQDSSNYAVETVVEGSARLTSDGFFKDDLVVCINHHKFMVMMRNEHLVHLAEKAIGSITSQIYETAIRRIETKILACKEDSYDDGTDDSEAEDDEADENETILTAPPKMTTRELALLIDEDPKYANALGTENLEKEDVLSHRKNRRKKVNGFHEKPTANGEVNPEDRNSSGSSEDESDENSIIDVDLDQEKPEDFYDIQRHHDQHHRTIRQHLVLLAQHPDRFLTHIHATPNLPERWVIDFRDLRQTAMLKVIFRTIDSRLGTVSTRLARICHEYGRMDDKTLQSKSLVPQKEMRARLHDMIKTGLLELQEVPRDNSRLATRTTFLYYMDERKVTAKITDECYKTIVRCMQRMEVEKEKVASVLEKVERTDVKGREDEILGDIEKVALGKWRAQEEMIWGEIGRVDNMVAILRDF